MTLVRQIRAAAGLTQTELAELAGTSQPAIAAYESGSKLPSLRTLLKLAKAADLDLEMTLTPALTREDRRSLALHERIAIRLLERPESTMERARANLSHMARRHPHAQGLLNEWGAILEQPIDIIAELMTDPSPRFRELRHITPFAGVLNQKERAEVYKEWRLEEAAR